MIEKGPDSVRRGRRRGEITWMPEKASGQKGDDFADSGSGQWLVTSGLSTLGVDERASARRPESWSSSLKRSCRLESRDCTARVARARCSVWNWSIAARSTVLITSTLWRRKGSSGTAETSGLGDE